MLGFPSFFFAGRVYTVTLSSGNVRKRPAEKHLEKFLVSKSWNHSPLRQGPSALPLWYARICPLLQGSFVLGLPFFSAYAWLHGDVLVLLGGNVRTRVRREARLDLACMAFVGFLVFGIVVSQKVKKRITLCLSFGPPVRAFGLFLFPFS